MNSKTRARKLRIGAILIVIALGATFVGRMMATDRTVLSLSIDEQEEFLAFKQLDPASKLQIADRDEPGERLSICARLVDKATRLPLTHQEISFYHTSLNGEYEPAEAGDESTARLGGSATTDEQGRLFVDTILPGNYGRSTDNRHVHTSVKGAQPEAYDIYFSQYSTFMGRRFSARSDQHFLTTLKRLPDSRLACFVTIEVKFSSEE